MTKYRDGFNEDEFVRLRDSVAHLRPLPVAISKT
jgi:hypothetical protein